jgi:uroporphyrinogen III methyltransferase / synthase
VARDLVPVELRRRGAQVDVVEAYRTTAPQRSIDLTDKPDWITFTSSSTVRNFVAMTGAEALAGEGLRLQREHRAIAIGAALVGGAK